VRRRRYLAGYALAVGSLGTAGCTGDDGGDRATVETDQEVYADALRDAVGDAGHSVHELSVADRVFLAYSPQEPTERGVEESIEDVGRAFFDRVYGGWDVDGLDARVRIDGALDATWRMEREWIASYIDGDLDREELGRRVKESVERHDGAKPTRSDD